MYKKCKTIKSAQRQKEFEQALLNLMEQMPYKDITITALCKQVGVQRKSFYRYFDEVEDILYALVDDVLIEAFLYLEVEADMENFFLFWKNKKNLLDILELHNLSHHFLDRAYERCIAKTEYQVMTAKELSFIAYSASFMTIVMAWNYGGMRQSVEEIAKMVRDMYKNS